MATKIKNIIAFFILFIQSKKIYRTIGKKVFHNIEISEPSEEEYLFVQKRMNPNCKHFSKVNNPNVNRFVARWHGKVIGFVDLVNHTSDNSLMTGYWLFSLNIMHIMLRGFGIGEALCSHLLIELKNKGASEVYLFVSENNLPAIYLYKKIGFERVIIHEIEKNLITEYERTGIRKLSMLCKF